MTHPEKHQRLRIIALSTLLVALFVAGTASSHEIRLHVLWAAHVLEVECHELRNDGHDYSIGGTATFIGKDGSSGKETKLVADILVSRLEDAKEADADSQYLCHALQEMKASNKSADVLWNRVTSNVSRPRKAIRSLTTIRGCDDNDRTGSSD